MGAAPPLTRPALGLVSFEGELVAEGGRRVAGVALVLDANGVRLRGPGPGALQLLPWRSIEHLRFDHPASLGDGTPAVGVRIGTTGRELCVVVSCDELPPARARALAGALAALVASERAERHRADAARQLAATVPPGPPN